MSVFRTLSRHALLAALALCGLLAVPANAQLGEAAGFQRALVPDFFRRDVKIFIDDLMLDESQQIILEQMLEDYQSSFDEGTQRMIENLQTMLPELQGGDQRRIMQIVFEPLTSWYREKLELRDEFLGDVHDILLSPEQQEMWPSFERRLRRAKTLQNGVLSGESTDLLLILKSLDLAPASMGSGAVRSNVNAALREALLPTLEDYEINLDVALRARNELEVESFEAMTRAIQTEDSDVALNMIDRQIASRVGVRDVNLRYISAIAEILPPDKVGEFQEEALQRSFPRIYNDTPIMRAFAAAMELEDLDPAVMSGLMELENTYLLELAVINAELVRLTKSAEVEQERQRAENYAARKRGERLQQSSDKLRPEFAKRDEFGNSYMRLIQSMLTEEQFASLPGAQRWMRKSQTDQSRARAGREATLRKQQETKLNQQEIGPPTGVRGGGSRGLGTNSGGKTGGGDN